MTHYRLWPALATHRGQRRRLNEDSLAYVYPDDPQILYEYGALFLLSDGVGGLSNGAHYSQQAVQSICSMYYQTPANNVGERLARVLRAVNDKLHKLDQGGAATIVVAVFHGDCLTIANAGDSPAYAISAQKIQKLTVDHTVDDPASPKSKRLFRALGYEETMTVDCVTGRVVSGMRILLCSDGVTRYYTDDQLYSVAQPHSSTHTVQTLVHGSYLRGGADNISAVMIEVGERLADGPALHHHIAALQPVLSLPEELSNVHPLFPPYMKPYSVGETAGTILDSAQRKSYLRTNALPLVSVSAPPVPHLDPTPAERRPRFWEWLGRRPQQSAHDVAAAPLHTNLEDAAQRGLRDHSEDDGAG